MEQRKIAFRAWDKINKEMCYKVLVGNTDIDDKNYTCNSILGKNGEWMNADDVCIDLMQYIGYKDAEGVEVYEGDILQDPHGNLFVVKWYEEEMRWAMWSKDTWYKLNMPFLKVVGNVYENPKLIKEKHI